MTPGRHGRKGPIPAKALETVFMGQKRRRADQAYDACLASAL